VPTEGLVSFREGSGGGAGVVGATSFRRAEALSQQQLSVADERLRQAAAVVAGQVDLEELTGPSTTRTRSQRVCPPLLLYRKHGSITKDSIIEISSSLGYPESDELSLNVAFVHLHTSQAHGAHRDND